MDSIDGGKQKLLPHLQDQWQTELTCTVCSLIYDGYESGVDIIMEFSASKRIQMFPNFSFNLFFMISTACLKPSTDRLS